MLVFKRARNVHLHVCPKRVQVHRADVAILKSHDEVMVFF